MPSLPFPDSGSRKAENLDGSGAPSRSYTVYADLDATTLAEIYADDNGARGTQITDARVVTDGLGYFPIWWGPNAGADLLYVTDGVIPPWPVYAITDARLDRMQAQVDGIIASGAGGVTSVAGRNGAVTLTPADVPGVATATAEAAFRAADLADTTNVHGIADTAALVLTDDTRLTDARTPLAHAGSHGALGTDPIAVTQGQVAGLGAALTAKADLVGGVIPTAQIPALAINQTWSVTSQSEMLALPAGQGDLAIRTDTSSPTLSFLLGAADPTVLSNWVPVSFAAIASVNGQTGVVVLGAADVGAVPAGRTITAGTGMTGGGDLTADRTMSVAYGTTSTTAARGDDSRITGAAQKSANLSDLASPSTARTSLGLGDSATRNVGSVTGTVATGDDSRIVGAAQKSSNLSDLASSTTARTNLGLGTAAVLNTGIGSTNVVVGSDSRLTDARTPATHASTHGTGGSDAVTVATSQVTGLDSTLALKADLVSGKIPTSQIPAQAVSDVFPVANEAAMLALNAQRGDLAIRSDFTPNRWFVLATDSPSTLADWKVFTAAGAVAAVNGQSGVVVLAPGDIGAVPTARAVNAGVGLTGGGDLTTDRTFDVAYGTTSTTAARGDDARLSDARTPTAHAASHTDGGSDELTLTTAQVTGLDTALGDKVQLGGDLSGTITAPVVGTGAITSAKIADATIVDADISGTAAIAATKVAGTALVASNNLSDVTAATARTNLAVPPAARTLTAGTGLTGGGDLTADRTLTVAYGTIAGTAAQGNDSRITGAAPLASPALTGTPTAPTATPGTNTTQLATTAFVAASDALTLHLAGTETVTGGKTWAAGTFLDKGNHVFDVKAYGTVGDDNGSTGTDDTTAIQAALTAAAAVSGGAVVMLNGNHKITTRLDIGSNTILDGSKGTLRQATNLTIVIRANNVTNVTIRNVRATGVGSDWFNDPAVFAATAVDLRGTTSDVVVENCRFSNFAGGGVIVNPGVVRVAIRGNVLIGPGSPPITAPPSTLNNYGTGIGLYDDNDAIEIAGNDISYFCQGVSTGKVQRVRVVDNHIHDIVGQHGLYLEVFADCVVTGNVVRDCALLGMKLQIGSTPALGWPDIVMATITGNVFENCGDQGILLTNPVAGSPTNRLRRIVVSGNTVSCDGSGDGININKTIGVIVTGNYIYNTRAGININNSSQATIANNRIVTCANQGISIDTVDDLMVLNNRIIDPASANGPTNEFGIEIVGASSSNIIIDGNWISDSAANMRYGIYQATGDQATISIRNNTVTGATDFGAKLDSTVAIKEWSGNVLSGTSGDLTGYPSGFVNRGTPRTFLATAAPTTGTWKAGDIVWNTAPSTTVFGWVCTTAGTPGTWTTIGPASSGDASTNTSTSVDSEVVLFNSTTGKSLKRATGSGVAKLTSGVLSVVTAPSGTIVGTTDTQTLTNKAITARIFSTASSATPTPDMSSYDQYQLTALAAAAGFVNPTSPTDGQSLIIRIKDNGTARALTWGTQYRGIGVTLPTTTVISKTMYVGCRWNATDTKLDILAVSIEA